MEFAFHMVSGIAFLCLCLYLAYLKDLLAFRQRLMTIYFQEHGFAVGKLGPILSKFCRVFAISFTRSSHHAKMWQKIGFFSLIDFHFKYHIVHIGIDDAKIAITHKKALDDSARSDWLSALKKDLGSDINLQKERVPS